ncbi:hypothetical protein HELRODRAFT_165332 [Helobdella robusta]|uniref:Uncharacterized protein n=1 Tax=Helobdella robusta TaxID=6412 RepID=T1EWL5_HELRO|nr:hypothetical protein HELRODRAFT_165332 [Helobdella robusta]ESN91318.1 hypothetical protein HELRODRAFT_165332 [Helobdella robusta]
MSADSSWLYVYLCETRPFEFCFIPRYVRILDKVTRIDSNCDKDLKVHISDEMLCVKAIFKRSAIEEALSLRSDNFLNLNKLYKHKILLEIYYPFYTKRPFRDSLQYEMKIVVCKFLICEEEVVFCSMIITPYCKYQMLYEKMKKRIEDNPDLVTNRQFGSNYYLDIFQAVQQAKFQCRKGLVNNCSQFFFDDAPWNNLQKNVLNVPCINLAKQAEMPTTLSDQAGQLKSTVNKKRSNNKVNKINMNQEITNMSQTKNFEFIAPSHLVSNVLKWNSLQTKLNKEKLCFKFNNIHNHQLSSNSNAQQTENYDIATTHNGFIEGTGNLIANRKDVRTDLSMCLSQEQINSTPVHSQDNPCFEPDLMPSPLIQGQDKHVGILFSLPLKPLKRQKEFMFPENKILLNFGSNENNSLGFEVPKHIKKLNLDETHTEKLHFPDVVSCNFNINSSNAGGRLKGDIISQMTALETKKDENQINRGGVYVSNDNINNDLCMKNNLKQSHSVNITIKNNINDYKHIKFLSGANLLGEESFDDHVESNDIIMNDFHDTTYVSCNENGIENLSNINNTNEVVLSGNINKDCNGNNETGLNVDTFNRICAIKTSYHTGTTATESLVISSDNYTSTAKNLSLTYMQTCITNKAYASKRMSGFKKNYCSLLNHQEIKCFTANEIFENCVKRHPSLLLNRVNLNMYPQIGFNFHKSRQQKQKFELNAVELQCKDSNNTFAAMNTEAARYTSTTSTVATTTSASATALSAAVRVTSTASTTTLAVATTTVARATSTVARATSTTNTTVLVAATPTSTAVMAISNVAYINATVSTTASADTSTAATAFSTAATSTSIVASLAAAIIATTVFAATTTTPTTFATIATFPTLTTSTTHTAVATTATFTTAAATKLSTFSTVSTALTNAAVFAVSTSTSVLAPNVSWSDVSFSNFSKIKLSIPTPEISFPVYQKCNNKFSTKFNSSYNQSTVKKNSMNDEMDASFLETPLQASSNNKHYCSATETNCSHISIDARIMQHLHNQQKDINLTGSLNQFSYLYCTTNNVDFGDAKKT